LFEAIHVPYPTPEEIKQAAGRDIISGTGKRGVQNCQDVEECEKEIEMVAEREHDRRSKRDDLGGADQLLWDEIDEDGSKTNYFFGTVSLPASSSSSFPPSSPSSLRTKPLPVEVDRNAKKGLPWNQSEAQSRQTQMETDTDNSHAQNIFVGCSPVVHAHLQADTLMSTAAHLESTIERAVASKGRFRVMLYAGEKIHIYIYT
tara:strand:- start:162 stop:770 length:609 start_codon:yes stop_codon:yes gene_type:complete